MKKEKVIEKILALLRGEMELFYKAAKASHEEATHEQNKAENKYDTRGLEAAYLAGAQARQAAAAEEAYKQFAALSTVKLGPDEAVAPGALVELETPDGPSFYFIGPKAGGLEVKMGKKEIVVLTPQSPLGGQLMGKKAGQKFWLKNGPLAQEYHILSVA